MEHGRRRVLFFTALDLMQVERRLAAMQAALPDFQVVVVDSLTQEQIQGKTGDTIVIDDVESYYEQVLKLRSKEIINFPVPTECAQIYRPNRQYGKRFRRSLRGGHR